MIRCPSLAVSYRSGLHGKKTAPSRLRWQTKSAGPITAPRRARGADVRQDFDWAVQQLSAKRRRGKLEWADDGGRCGGRRTVPGFPFGSIGRLRFSCSDLQHSTRQGSATTPRGVLPRAWALG